MKQSPHLYGNINPCFIPRIADKLLNEYCNIAESLKIKTFLCFGTCLGFIRDDGYIKYDNDIDVGISRGINELGVKLEKNGFIIKRSPCLKSWHFLKYKILLDIFTNFPESHWKYFQSFDKVTYKGKIYNVPHPVEKYLKTLYGNWKTRKLRA